MCEEVQRLLEEHLQKSGSYNTPVWEIRKSRHGGRGVFARRDIKEGEIIFVDYPLILGPRTSPEEVCVGCYKNNNLRVCNGDCGLPVCCEECEVSTLHKAECERIKKWKTEGSEVNKNIFRCLTPIRALFLSDSGVLLMKNLAAHLNPVHGTEVNVLKHKMKLNIPHEDETLMRMACAVLDANAFEVLVHHQVPTLRGLYPLSSLMNHNCTPNTTHVFDSKQFMIIRATVPIKQNEEVFTTYCRLIWGTLSRRFHLFRTKHFTCDCERCKDPTEFRTYMNSIICTVCGGNVIPIEPLKSKSDWICENCAEETPGSKIGFITTDLAKRLAALDANDLNEIIGFYKERLARNVPETNQIFLELKYRVIWIVGYKDGCRYAETSDELLQTKINFCRDILDVLEKLRLGQCKMRGLLLYEILKCEVERKKRNLVDKSQPEVEKSLAEIANTFLFDVSAPKEIQLFWKNNKIESDWRNYL